jgi:hypothetical protein
MLLWLVVCTKKGIQDEDVQIGEHLLSIHRCLCEHGNFAPHVANRGLPRSMTPASRGGYSGCCEWNFWNQHTKGISASGCRPLNCLESVVRTRAISHHLQCVQALSLQDYPARVMFCQRFLQQCSTNPNFPVFVIFTDEE